jgi:hypothetical protein
LIDGWPDFIANLHILLIKPARDSTLQEITIQALGESIIVARIADKAGIVLNGLTSERSSVGNECVGNSSPPEKYIRDFAFRTVNCINTNR